MSETDNQNKGIVPVDWEREFADLICNLVLADHIGEVWEDVFTMARKTGFVTRSELDYYEKRLEEDFSEDYYSAEMYEIYPLALAAQEKYGGRLNYGGKVIGEDDE